MPKLRIDLSKTDRLTVHFLKKTQNLISSRRSCASMTMKQNDSEKSVMHVHAVELFFLSKPLAFFEESVTIAVVEGSSLRPSAK